MTDANSDLVQVRKSDLELLQRSYKILDGLWDDENVGQTIQERAKTVDPKIRTDNERYTHVLRPITEKLTATETTAKELAEKLSKLEQEREDEKALNDLRKTLDSAQSKYRLTDEGMAEVKKIMAERNIADPMAAAAFVVSEIEPPKPVTGTNFGPADLNVLGIDGSAEDASTKALHKDPVRWLDQAVPAIMQEFEQEAA